MHDTCEFRLYDESLCGVPTAGVRPICEFHDTSVSRSVSSVKTVRKYLESQDNKEYALSGSNLSQLDLLDLGINFDAPVSFAKAKLSNCRLEERVYGESIDFDGAHLKNLRINKSHFKRKLDFRTCTIVGGTLDEVIFSEDVIFGDSPNRSLSNVTFRSCTFKAKAIFRNLRIEGTRFYGCNFHGETRFDDSILESSLFHHSNLCGPVTTFQDSRIESTDPTFQYCYFEPAPYPVGENRSFLSFDRSILRSSTTIFDHCRCSATNLSFASSFMDAERFFLEFDTSDGIHYNGHVFKISVSKLSITDLRFAGHFEFSTTDQAVDRTALIEFSNIQFQHMKSANFVKADLRKASFTGSLLFTCNFMNCKWPRKPDSRISSLLKDRDRKLLYDEIQMLSNGVIINNEELVRLYVQLKRNFDESYDYVGAGDWFFREMEARRRGAREHRKWYSLSGVDLRLSSSAYKQISRYGESVAWAFIWILIAYVSFSVLYLMNGFPIDANNQLNYDFGSSGKFEWSDIYRAFAFGFQAMTLRLKSYVDFQIWNAWPIFFLHFLSTATLVPLFLLALRRKFRR